MHLRSFTSFFCALSLISTLVLAAPSSPRQGENKQPQALASQPALPAQFSEIHPAEGDVVGVRVGKLEQAKRPGKKSTQHSVPHPGVVVGVPPPLESSTEYKVAMISKNHPHNPPQSPIEEFKKVDNAGIYGNVALTARPVERKHLRPWKSTSGRPVSPLQDESYKKLKTAIEKHKGWVPSRTPSPDQADTSKSPTSGENTHASSSKHPQSSTGHGVNAPVTHPNVKPPSSQRVQHGMQKLAISTSGGHRITTHHSSSASSSSHSAFHRPGTSSSAHGHSTPNTPHMHMPASVGMHRFPSSQHGGPRQQTHPHVQAPGYLHQQPPHRQLPSAAQHAFNQPPQRPQTPSHLQTTRHHAPHGQQQHRPQTPQHHPSTHLSSHSGPSQHPAHAAHTVSGPSRPRRPASPTGGGRDPHRPKSPPVSRPASPGSRPWSSRPKSPKHPGPGGSHSASHRPPRTGK
ncbi:hypothetical protein CPC08DRAFT_759201 [Agrocybe pediades]|nr:hypothetical protein CPC08DRAFT_759201 [Agrocybe pediades]